MLVRFSLVALAAWWTTVNAVVTEHLRNEGSLFKQRLLDAHEKATAREHLGGSIGDPKLMTHVFHTTNVYSNQAKPDWGFLKPSQADDVVWDGSLGWKKKDGGEENRPAGVFLIPESRAGGTDEPVGNWYPRGGSGTFHQAKIDITSAFVLDYDGANPVTLDKCIMFTCYPQSAMGADGNTPGQAYKVTGQGKQQLTIFVHPEEKTALGWIAKHAKDNTKTGKGAEQNKGKYTLYAVTTCTTDKNLEFNKGKWYASTAYNDDGKGTNNIFVLGKVSLADVTWIANKHT